MQTIYETEQGGCVVLNKAHGVKASCAVATVGDRPAPEVLYAWATLQDGRCVQFFLNRETGLAVVDVVAANGRAGVEILRQHV